MGQAGAAAVSAHEIIEDFALTAYPTQRLGMTARLVRPALSAI